MHLTSRLKTIADSIDKCSCVADIGSDHALLPIYLIKNNKADKAIATDINKGPAGNSRKRIQQYGLDNLIDVRVDFGLKALKDNEADVIIISGMGGLLIADIIKESHDIAKSAKMLVLQPMRDGYLLRKWLVGNGFKIIDADIVKEEKKFYEIIWVKPCNKVDKNRVINYIDDKLIIKKSPVLAEYIESKMAEYEKIIKELRIYDTPNAVKRLKECNAILEYYKGVKACLRQNAEL